MAAQGPETHPRFHVQEGGHVVEELGGIRRAVDCEPLLAAHPTELRKNMVRRRPKASKRALERRIALGAFDNSIAAGLSYGVTKAQLLRVKAALLGNLAGQLRFAADPEKTEAMQFDALREQTHVR